MFPRQEQHAYVKIEFARNKRPCEIHAALEEACKEEAVDRSTVTRWMQRLRDGDLSIEDKDRSGRPLSATDEAHEECVQKLLDEDRRITCDEVATELGISHGSAYKILTLNLGKRKVTARWVPHRLKDEEKLSRYRIAMQLRRRYRREGEDFLERIVAIDETWIRSYEPELKRQSSEWRSPDSPRPQKFRREQSKVKQMMIFAYDHIGIILADAVPIGQTVNKEYYADFISKKLKNALRRKRPSLQPLILHDNARCHTAQHVTETLDSMGWEVLPHPAYSPDLSPPDFNLFPKLKEPMRGKRYATLEDLSVAVKAQIRSLNSEGLDGIEKLPQRWESVIRSKGDYIEGL